MACFRYEERYFNAGFLGLRYYNPEVGRFDKSDSLFLREPERCFERPEECQLYSYVANAPTRWVDRDGRKIQVNGSGQFKAYVAQIVAVAINDKNSALHKLDVDLCQTFNVYEIQSNGKKFPSWSYSEPIKGNIFLVMNGGIFWRFGITDGGLKSEGVISPAIVAEHEAAHVYEGSYNTTRYIAEKFLSKIIEVFTPIPVGNYGQPAYPNLHERRVVEVYEWAAAGNLNNPKRTEHAAVGVITQGPFSSSISYFPVVP
jgi:RHS repeat-associated protein